MNIDTFCRQLPKLELHAHLNGSLSRFTMLELQRYLADNGMADKSNVFLDEFQIGAGDTRNLSDCFQVFNIAHALTSTKKTLSMATALTIKEFEDDGCCYIELRSTPRTTPHMTMSEYVETIVQTMRKETADMTIISCLIISINRSSTHEDANIIADVAIEYHTKYPDTVVGIELSGNPAVGKFQNFLPALDRARKAGLKVTLHCGEICNQQEVIEMLNFKPDRIGHGVCIHPLFGGNDATWELLCKSQIPVEICLTSNVNTKSTQDYNSHHFKELYNAKVPVVICTDDKGVFATSLSQEYRICAETFGIEQSKLARLSLSACNYIFAEDKRKILSDTMLNFINKYEL
ncbi:adenosine deaminase-like protein isoform X2 [Bicyclus anynana]|uniref:Adenosine deaminase-like protein isoform X2 n=1 Tax=Bicyclus anynana TaxID=110368 RepID=A0A6J1P045_BICAN|nr:adenosine deaminase-like protein isoform X2 [Bicyclus anynana]XP_052738109.1 adenosine deaminase-like protein isoform X2 [Bicyclus anynana]XP_052738110.1 adenosine deaminase-like protein isoform X2 [Bicyclus anynana]